ncbi:MAG: retropepsin-like aspartic protease [Asticcacaulis sp.]
MAERLSTAMSRRGLLSTLIVMPVLGLGMNAGAQEQTSDITHETASLKADTDNDQRLTIEVMINNKGPYRFIVDTGAESSVLADNVATELGLVCDKTLIVKDIASRITVPAALIEDMSFGPFKRQNLTLPVMPRANLLMDGYLGLDMIKGTQVTFDFKHMQVRVSERKSRYMPGSALALTKRLPAVGANGRLFITDCVVDGIAASAFIDTGAEVSVGNLALGQALMKRNRRSDYVGSLKLTGVSGGQVKGNVLAVKNIQMERMSFRNGLMAIADVPGFNIWQLTKRPALMIGMDYLRQFDAVTIDFHNKELSFLIAPPVPNARHIDEVAMD